MGQWKFREPTVRRCLDDEACGYLERVIDYSRLCTRACLNFTTLTFSTLGKCRNGVVRVVACMCVYVLSVWKCVMCLCVCTNPQLVTLLHCPSTNWNLRPSEDTLCHFAWEFLTTTKKEFSGVNNSNADRFSALCFTTNPYHDTETRDLMSFM